MNVKQKLQNAWNKTKEVCTDLVDNHLDDIAAIGVGIVCAGLYIWGVSDGKKVAYSQSGGKELAETVGKHARHCSDQGGSDARWSNLSTHGDSTLGKVGDYGKAGEVLTFNGVDPERTVDDVIIMYH